MNGVGIGFAAPRVEGQQPYGKQGQRHTAQTGIAIVHREGGEHRAADNRADGIAEVKRHLYSRAGDQLAAALAGFGHQQLLWSGSKEQSDGDPERQYSGHRLITRSDKHQQQAEAGDGLTYCGRAGMPPMVGQTTSKQTADDHTKAGKHHQHRHQGRRPSAGFLQPGGDVAPPAEHTGIAGEHGGQNHPRATAGEELELTGDACVLDRCNVRNPRRRQHNRHCRPSGQNAEGKTPGKELGHQGARRYAEHIGHGLSGDHHGYGLRLLAFLRQSLGDECGCAEECAVRQAGDESCDDQHGGIDGECGSQIAHQGNHHKQYDEVLRRHLAAEYQNQCAEAHADRIRGNVMACGGDVHAGGGRGLRQNAHHHELGGTENERARSQCKQTLLHGSSNYFSITYKNSAAID